MGKNTTTRNKFVITMIIIIICATLVNYGLHILLDTYITKPSDTYFTVQLNIIITIVILGIVTLIMLVLIPKDNVNELMMIMEGGGGSSNNNRTDEQKLQDLIDEELYRDEENK